MVISSISKYLHYRSPIDINGVVVHHLHNGHTEVAPDPEGDAEAQAAEDGDDVALGQAKTATVQQRGRTRGRRHWTPIFCQFYIVLFLYIASIYFSMRAKKNEITQLITNYPHEVPFDLKVTVPVLSGNLQVHHSTQLVYNPQAYHPAPI